MNAKRLFSGLLTATIVLAPLAILKPASANEQSNNQLMAQADLSPGERAAARSQAVQSLTYQEKTAELNRLIQQFNNMKRIDPRRFKVRSQMKRLQKELEDIVRQYEEGRRAQRPSPSPAQSFHTAPSRPGSSHSNHSRG